MTSSQLRVLLFISVVFVFSACSESTSPPSQSSIGVDPTGGSWKTIVLSSSSAITAAAPAANNSAATTSEIAQIKSLQSSLSLTQISDIERWDSSAVIRWNEIARQLVIRHSTNPPMASRAYTLMSVAQYDASVTVWKLKYAYNRPAPSKLDASVKTYSTVSDLPSYPSDHAAIAAASASVLRSLYPNDVVWIDSLLAAHEASRISGGYNYPSDITTGDSIGLQVGEIILSGATSDGSDAAWSGTIPTGDSCWYSAQTPAAPPLLPMWGDVKCWVITDMNAVSPAPPPSWNSSAYLASLQEVRAISDTRTQGQIDTAIQWADGNGTYTPPGHWNAIAAQAMLTRGWSTLRQARAMALMNMAMMDAGVCCWKMKYVYWLIRPSEADSKITLAVPLPNFPSYCSGHSSFSAAGAEVLDYLLPDMKVQFDGWASAAAISRVYGGIHYRFDSDAGLVMGKKIGDLAVARGKSDGSD
ncbi:MAG TPA: phosphatase PAP2 family protein [Candidatus Kapabacteria bacterium]|jgi:membrane-associated phospholipid phosphatase|nr:phosphatase PAP2 family protein [Candidatus Kapabacteria bacterium]